MVKYDYKKTLMKFAKSLVLVILAGALSLYADNLAVFGLIPVVEAALNYFKHK